ncbi:MAG: DCC1-like thiol-disulfide oxidoreductase family protein [Panacibacter sp.]
MNTDYNKALIYDANCPLCKAYTGAFVKGGLLKEENRISFSEVNMQQFHIDWHRAKHEIPLINLHTGEVKYGVDALADILQQKFLFINALLKIRVLNYFFRKLYKLVSYNRKIIVAAKTPQTSGIDCTPDYSFVWRWLLIIVCYSISNFFIVTSVARLFGFYNIDLSPWLILWWMLAPVAISMVYSKITATDIHAHVSVTATITGFLLLVMSLFIKYFYKVPWLFYLIPALILIITLKQCVRRYYFIPYFKNR